ncbi:MAG: SLBB domain-containing protein [Planctomycetaceae bacterium]|nr:SLBB domain-containing protein [Planctomycetaceae bacterium]
MNSLQSGMMALGLSVVMSCVIVAGPGELSAAKVIEFHGNQNNSPAPPMIAIIGAVQNPGTYELKQTTIPLHNLIQQAGGLTEAAGKKIQIVRAGRAGIVLPVQSQTDYELQAGDAVLIEKTSAHAGKVVSFDPASLNQNGNNSAQIIRATHQNAAPRETQFGHIVLIGIQDYPVVMPLWRADLTSYDLLTQWLKQPAEVAEKTKFVAGRRDRTAPEVLQDGTVLQIPGWLVQSAELPKLPSPIPVVQAEPAKRVETAPLVPPQSNELQRVEPQSAGQQTTEPKMDFRPSVPSHHQWLNEDDISSELKAVPFSKTEKPTATEQTEGLRLPSIMPSAESHSSDTNSQEAAGGNVTSLLQSAPTRPQVGLLTLPRETSELTTDENNFLMALQNDIEVHEEHLEIHDADSQVPPSFEASLSGTSYIAENLAPANDDRTSIHLAAADEIIPEPLEMPQAGGSSLVGLIAGGIVIIGVFTVILASIRSHLTGQGEMEYEPELSESRPMTTAKPVREPVHSSTEKTEENDVLELLTEDRMPVIEERVLLPREMQFFGKPHLHYEFRVDGSHEVPKPHIRTRRPAPETQEPQIGEGPKAKAFRKSDVQWQGEFGTEPNHTTYVDTTPNLR